ncbi:hypothetical protein PC111_g22006 [Phytophthora cactorum]|nr:hypothetical protein PC111_g22006 [Phytophthora cactorum]
MHLVLAPYNVTQLVILPLQLIQMLRDRSVLPAPTILPFGATVPHLSWIARVIFGILSIESWSMTIFMASRRCHLSAEALLGALAGPHAR